MLVIVSFFLLAILQLASGWILTPLVPFTRAVLLEPSSRMAVVHEELFDGIFWAMVSGIFIGSIFGNFLHWLFLLTGSTMLIFVVRNYVFLSASPFVISLLLALFLLLIFGLNGPVDFRSFAILYFIYSLLFSPVYAFFPHQKNHQRRIF